MGVGCTLSIMAIGVGWGLMGETMVDRRGCYGIEEFIYGGALVGMRVVDGPIHRWEGWEEGPVSEAQAEQRRDLKGIAVGSVGRWGRKRKRGEEGTRDPLAGSRKTKLAPLR